MAKTVLVITHSSDGPADWVVRAVRARGCEVVRFDTDRFPAEVQLVLEQSTTGAPRFMLRDGPVQVDLTSVHSVWYRRFYGAKLAPELEERYVQYSRGETRTLLSALFAALPNARWIDPIDRVHRAHHKVLQLELAKAAGFSVPDTLATNDPSAVRAFFARHHGSIVTKMLNAVSFTDDGKEQMVFTSRVTEAHLAELEGLRHCPAVFQELVPKEVELRVAVVGERLFAASIDASSSATGNLDWRQDDDLAYKFVRAELPAEVEQSVLKLMKSFGLTYGSLDIIRRPDGEHVFLEINSAGEWGWLVQMVGLPIDEALAEALTQ